MPKSQHAKFATGLTASEIKQILSSILAGAAVEPLTMGPLDAPAAIAIVATQRGTPLKRSPFGNGNAVAQVIVEDHGSTRHVELIAVANTFMEGLNAQRAAGNAMAGLSVAAKAPNPKAGRNMVAAIYNALQAADRGIRQVQ